MAGVTRRTVLVAAALVLGACGPPGSVLPRYIVATTVAPGQQPVGEDVYAHTRAGDIAPAMAKVPTRVYVPNSDSDTVDVIDPATFAIVDHFDVGNQPQHITPSWDMTTLYVDNTRGHSLTPIDPLTGRPGAPIVVEDPYNLYFTPDGAKAVVVAEELRRLDFRDPKTWQLIKSLPIPHSGADHADFSADGKTMVVSCEFSGWIVRVDVESMTLTGELHLGGQPIDVKLGPDGRNYFVANQERGGVSIVDADALYERAFVPTGAGAHGMYPSRDGRSLYVSNRKEGSVSVLDFATGHELEKWHIGGSPDMGGVSADGRQLWLAGRYDRAVYVIDTETGKLIGRIEVGKGPHGLALFPQPGRYSLGHTGNYR